MAKLLKYDGADVVSKYAENDTKGRKISSSIDEINQKIADLKAVGRFLSVWDCTTGKPTSNPPGQAPYDYTYQTGDYYIIGVVGTNNYKPTGTKYTGAASSVVESNAVYANDFYRYAGNGDWQLISSSQRTITFSMIEGEVNTNAKLSTALDAKQNKITSTAKLSASLIATDANNRFVTDTEKGSWDGKQTALSSSNKLNPSYINWNDNYASVSKTNKDSWNAKQSALSSTNKLDTAYINWNTNYRAVTDAEKTTWNAKQSALSDAQLGAVNSGITAAKVSTYDGYASTIAGKLDKPQCIHFTAYNTYFTSVEEDNSCGIYWTTRPAAGENTGSITGWMLYDGDSYAIDLINRRGPIKLSANSGITSGSSDKNYAILDTDNLTQDRKFHFPDKEGTLALAGDIPQNVVTTDAMQTISGRKTFSNSITEFTSTLANGAIRCDVYGTSSFKDMTVCFGDDDTVGDYGIYLDSMTENSGTTHRYTYIKTSSTATTKGAAPTITLPNKNGTVALTNDIKITAEDYTIGS